MSTLPPFNVSSFDLGNGPTQPDPAMMASGHVPAGAYVGEDRFAQEAELLGKIWLNIADEFEVANPGDWIVREVAARNTSVLISRDAKGVLRAFHNICRHRGMQLVWGKEGNGTRFSCPYHAWTYSADGALKALPDEECFPGLDKEESALRPIAIGVWEGFIYINLDPAPAQTLEEFMAPVSARFRNLPLKGFTRHAKMRARMNSNWKLLLEAQSESYHIRALHARTVSSMVSSNANPFCHPLFWEGMGPHRTWSTAINPMFELSETRPVQKFAFMASAQIVAAKGAAGLDEAPPSGFKGDVAIDRGDPTIWGSDNMVIFPHIQVNSGGNGCWMHRFWPVSADVTDWESQYYFTPPRNLRQDFAQNYTMAFNRDTLIEDNNACSRQQSVLKSGAVDFIQFGTQEMACRHNAAVVQAAIDDLQNLPQAAE